VPEQAEFINKNFIYAVVGVSRNPEKYGHKVFFDLKENGYKVYPINPKVKEVKGITCYPDLESLPEKPEVVVLVVPPEIGLKILKEGMDLKIKKFWFQPGAESKEIIEFAKKNNLKIMAGTSCLMLTKK